MLANLLKDVRWIRQRQGDERVVEPLEANRLAKLTSEIVAAYVAHNPVAPSDLAVLIGAVATQLGRLGNEAEAAEEAKPEPAVSVRRSIRPDHLVCLVCGKKMKLLKRHLAVDHSFTPDEYRQSFGLKADYPMAAPNYVQQRREIALAVGLGRPRKKVQRPRRRRAVRTANAE
jgi:predicted transcriptional regulator